ncbi:MAG: WXG100 family type VII secretion target [Lachnospiraceae bacterium]|nr:WXG100 family type VII secretion target [Lachnospiraceae bacterium]
MAVEKIRINTGSLSKTQKEVQAELDKIQSDMEKISDDMNTLNSMWTGDAHDAFVQSVSEDLSLLTEVCTVLQNIINYESSAVTEYDKCEQQVSEIIAQIRI